MVGIVAVSRDVGTAELDRLSRQKAAHSENKQSEFRQHGTLKPFQKGK